MQFHADIQKIAVELARTGRYFHFRKWSLATSSNYSVKISPNAMLITSSGKDKQFLRASDMMITDLEGKPVDEHETRKPSAETLLHCQIYKRLPHVGSVLHTHSVAETVLSMKNKEQGRLLINGLEMLKAFEQVKTHEHEEIIPIFENHQDMTVLSGQVDEYMTKNPGVQVYMIAGHGLYTWGKTLAEAKTRIEAIEFLLECRLNQELLEKK